MVLDGDVDGTRRVLAIVAEMRAELLGVGAVAAEGPAEGALAIEPPAAEGLANPVLPDLMEVLAALPPLDETPEGAPGEDRDPSE